MIGRGVIRRRVAIELCEDTNGEGFSEISKHVVKALYRLDVHIHIIPQSCYLACKHANFGQILVIISRT